MSKVKDVMTEDVVTISGSATIAEAVQLMKFKNIHSLIVERRHEEDAYGIVTDTDISSQVVAYGKDPKQVRVYEVMTKPCIVVNPDLAVEYAARLFSRVKIDRAPVIHEKLLGIVSLRDILTKGDFIENPRVPLLEKSLQSAIANARATAAQHGTESEVAVTAWNTVHEIEAELSFCKSEAPSQSVSELFGETPAAVPVST